MKEQKKISDTDNLQQRLFITFGWFIVTIVVGIYILYHPTWIGIGIISVGFLIFNVFTTLYNLILLSVRRISKTLEEIINGIK